MDISLLEKYKEKAEMLTIQYRMVSVVKLEFKKKKNLTESNETYTEC